MLGGVDSSVVAAFLKHEGHSVGITLQLYDHGEAAQAKGLAVQGQIFKMQGRWPPV